MYGDIDIYKYSFVFYFMGGAENVQVCWDCSETLTKDDKPKVKKPRQKGWSATHLA